MENGGDFSSLPLNGSRSEGQRSLEHHRRARTHADFGGGSEDIYRSAFRNFATAHSGRRGVARWRTRRGTRRSARWAYDYLRLPRNLNINQPHGMLYVSDDTGGLDAKSYSFERLKLPRPVYNCRDSAALGGPLNFRKSSMVAIDVFLSGWNATRSTPYDASRRADGCGKGRRFSAATYKDAARYRSSIPPLPAVSKQCPPQRH